MRSLADAQTRLLSLPIDHSSRQEQAAQCARRVPMSCNQTSLPCTSKEPFLPPDNFCPLGFSECPSRRSSCSLSIVQHKGRPPH